MSEITPIKRPLNLAPGTVFVLNADGAAPERENGTVLGGVEDCIGGGIDIVWATVGVGGAEVAGLGDSTSHILKGHTIS